MTYLRLWALRTVCSDHDELNLASEKVAIVSLFERSVRRSFPSVDSRNEVAHCMTNEGFAGPSSNQDFWSGNNKGAARVEDDETPDSSALWCGIGQRR